MTYNTDRRRSMTQPQRAAFLMEHGCACYWCGLPIVTDEWDVEHLLAKELMPPGSAWDAPENKKPIHRGACHKAKTAADRRLIAKSNRIRQKHGRDPVRRKPRPKMKGPGFQKGSRPMQSRGFDRRAK